MIKSPYATKLTRQGQRDMKNRKPYRTGELRERARREAFRCEDGTFRTLVSASFH